MKRCARLFLLLFVLSALVACWAKPVGPGSNSIMVIAPYKHAGTWVFDEPSRGLKQEPFVAGIPEMIDQLVAEIPDAEEGFRLTFSAREFPGYTHTLEWTREDETGNWYYSPEFEREGWLCPALFKYFKEPPKTLYIKADPK